MKNLNVSCDPKGIELAHKSIKNGEVVIFPTDTVYGIGCDPLNSEAVMKIYNIKNRDPTKLLPVLGYSKKELENIAFFDEQSNKIAENFWPGPLTLILKLKDKKFKKTMNLSDKIAVRVPNNGCILSILEKCKYLVGTSANTSGSDPFIDPEECMKNMKQYDVFIDGGKILSRGESTIVEIECNKVKIHRVGSITKEEIMKII